MAHTKPVDGADDVVDHVIVMLRDEVQAQLRAQAKAARRARWKAQLKEIAFVVCFVQAAHLLCYLVTGHWYPPGA